jgi:hypothetical protein
MKHIWISAFIITIVFLSIWTQSYADGDQDTLEDYYGSALENLLQNQQKNIVNEKRSCVRRGGTCDHRPNDCCPKSACRCNLWGTNCRCQRLGLFQKWGKR